MIVVFGIQNGRLSDKAPYNRLGADYGTARNLFWGGAGCRGGDVVWCGALPDHSAAPHCGVDGPGVGHHGCGSSAMV